MSCYCCWVVWGESVVDVFRQTTEFKLCSTLFVELAVSASLRGLLSRFGESVPDFQSVDLL